MWNYQPRKFLNDEDICLRNILENEILFMAQGFPRYPLYTMELNIINIVNISSSEYLQYYVLVKAGKTKQKVFKRLFHLG